MWQTIALILFGVVIGIIIGVFIDKDTFYKVTVGKIKQRGKGNTLESELNVKLPPQTSRQTRKAKRVKKRLDKKL